MLDCPKSRKTWVRPAAGGVCTGGGVCSAGGGVCCTGGGVCCTGGVVVLVSVFCGGATGVLVPAGGPSLLLGGVATPEVGDDHA